MVKPTAGELARALVRPFIAIFLIIIWGVLVVIITLDGGDAMDSIPRELTGAALSYISAYGVVRSWEKRRDQASADDATGILPKP